MISMRFSLFMSEFLFYFKFALAHKFVRDLLEANFCFVQFFYIF